MIVDYHAHIWRYENPAMATPYTECTAEWLLRAMDRAEVDRAVIVPLVYVPTAKARRVLLDNEYILESVKKYPDRLAGFVTIDPKANDATEVVKTHLDQGLVGLKILPTAHNFLMSDHLLLDPLMTICAEYRAPISIRANDDIGSTPLQIEEMARSFPEVPAFVIDTMGRKWLMPEAMMVAKRTKNVYLETSETSVEEIFAVYDGCGPENLLYATNSQFYMDEMVEHIQRHKRVITNSEEQEMVFYKNATKILKNWLNW
jgi:predicted TIM-barrel fold metal-dependent hydrolase